MNTRKATLLAALGILICGPAWAKPGLLIVGHGAPMPAWNEIFTLLVDDVREVCAEREIDIEIEGAFLEFTTPSATDGIAALEAKGCDPVIVAPAFVIPSEHSEFDLPGVLGSRFDPTHVEGLLEEGLNVALPETRTIFLPAMVGWNKSMGKALTDRALALSEDPAREGVLVLMHGSGAFQGLIDRALASEVTPLLAEAGFRDAEGDPRVAYASVGMGGGHGGPPAGAAGEHADRPHGAGLPVDALNSFGGDVDRVLVLAAYVATTPDRLFREWPAETDAGAEIALTDTPLFPHPALAEGLIDLVEGALEVLCTEE